MQLRIRRVRAARAARTKRGNASASRAAASSVDDAEVLIGDESPAIGNGRKKREDDFSLVCGDEDDFNHRRIGSMVAKDGFVVDELLKDQLQAMGMSSHDDGDASVGGAALGGDTQKQGSALGGQLGGGGGAGTAVGAAGGNTSGTHQAATQRSQGDVAGIADGSEGGGGAAKSKSVGVSQLDQLAQLERELGLESLTDDLRDLPGGDSVDFDLEDTGGEQKSGHHPTSPGSLDLGDLGLDGIEGLEDFDVDLEGLDYGADVAGGDGTGAASADVDIDVDASLAEIENYLDDFT
jgi:hypothetical protein